MADALCGPSNALQNFQKHSQVDRTLQQDRLVSRQGPSQGFRSNQPNAGILDPEFAAFEAGQLASPPPQFDARHFQPQQHVPRFASPSPSTLPDWANDFQRLHISNARPAPSSPAPAIQHTPVVRHSPQASASWHQDFMQTQGMSAFQPQQPMFQHRQFPDMSWEYDQAPQFSPIAQGKQPAVEQQHEQWNAEAFADAFEAATKDALAEEDALAMEIQNEREEIEYLIAKKEREETAKRYARQETNHLTALDLTQDLPEHEAWPDDLQHEEMMREQIHEEPREAQAEAEKQDVDRPPMVDEELARTAGHLLDSVSHDTSQKFQESVFLQLMRRLRDKEVTVEGENFVETGSSGATSPAFGDRPASREEPIIPVEEQDSDLGRFGRDDEETSGDQDVELPTPSRPLTPDIDPPAPLFEDWRQRLFSAFEP